MPALSAGSNVAQSVQYSKTVFGIAQPLPLNFPSPDFGASNFAWGAGSGAKQYNNCTEAASVGVAYGTPLVLDLTSCPDPAGATVTFADVVAIWLSCPSTNTNPIAVGAGTDPVAWLTNAITMYPGMGYVMVYPVVTGLAITASTACKVTFTAQTSGTQNISYVFLGH
jgi:hypothetical protein